MSESAVASAVKYQQYIGGQWVDAADSSTYAVVDPATREVIATVPNAGPTDADAAVRAARDAFERGDWSTTTQERRCEAMLKIADLCDEVAGDWAMLEAREAGSTLRKTLIIDIPLAIEHFRQMAEQARQVSWYEPVPWTDMPHVSWNFLERSPIGVCVGLVPWNFPLPIAMWKLAPALAMGNSVVIKPSPLTPLTLLEFAKVVDASGLIPPGVFNVVTGESVALGETLVQHPEVDKVSFTGSTATGRIILSQAAPTIKKVTVELGGKSANIVCADADLDIAVDGTLFGTFLHQGQLCESGTRAYVHESIYDAFMQRLVATASQLVVGETLDPETQIGPIISQAQYERIQGAIDRAVAEGATLRCGGKRPPHLTSNGFYLEPTILDNVDDSAFASREELFGPVLVVHKWSTEKEVIQRANDSIYGLAGGIWSRDTRNAITLARKLRCGTVWINDWHMLNGLAPFGGFKQSGNGRELGKTGLLEYTEVKHIHVDQGVPRVDRFAYDVVLGSSN